MGVIYEPYLDASDYEDIGIEFRRLWSTRRLALNFPTATILRYTKYPNPQTLSSTTMNHSGLNIIENLVGRTVNLVEGALDQDFVITAYTSTSISVATGDFLNAGFTTACTFYVDALSYQKLESPTKVQVTTVESGSESLLNREVAYYNLTEKELLQFNNELDMFDRRFIFYDLGEMQNDDTIVSNGQQYGVYKQNFTVTYNKSVVYGKALRKS